MKEDLKTNPPLLSVIIPCYNVEKYLERCLESVVGQTYQNLEIILIDDGSPDSSGQICDIWAKRDSRIKVLHKENEGLGLARNSGLDIASGEWVAFIDSDDFIDKSMYAKLMLAAAQTNSCIAYCGHYKQLNNSKFLVVNDFNTETVFEQEQLVELSQGFFRPTSISPQMLTMSVWHAIYRKKIIKQYFYSEREVGSEDIHFQVSAMLNATRVVFIPDALYTYCYNGESLSHTFNMAKYECYKRLNLILNDTYKPWGVESPADYCVLIIAFTLIRNITMSSTSKSEKKIAMSTIVHDPFWDNDHIDVRRLRGAKKIFYKVLKRHSLISMIILASLYSIYNYGFKKKAIE